MSERARRLPGTCVHLGVCPAAERGSWSTGAAVVFQRSWGSGPCVLLLFVLGPGCRPWPPTSLESARCLRINTDTTDWWAEVSMTPWDLRGGL